MFLLPSLPETGSQVIGEPALLAFVEAQAELGAAPEDVFRGPGPFVFAQVLDLGGVEIGAEVFAEIGQPLGIAQDR